MTVTYTAWATTTATPVGVQPVRRPAAPQVANRDPMMTVEQVVKACQLSDTAVRRAISDGELRASKLRNRLRISPADYDAWIASTRTGGSSRPAVEQPATRRGARRPARTGRFRTLANAGDQTGRQP